MAADGLLTKPKDGLRTLLAASSNARSFLGAADVAAAKARIHIYEADLSASEEADKYSLIAVTYGEGDFGATREAVGAGLANYDFSRVLTVIFEASGESSAQEAFENQVGLIIKDIMDLSDPANSYVYVTEFSLVGVGYDDNAKIFSAVWRVTLK